MQCNDHSFLQIDDHLPKVLIVVLILNNVGVASLFGVEDLVDGKAEGIVDHPWD